MDRTELAALLGADDAACTMARSALVAGADFSAPRGEANAARLAGTYRTRMRISDAKNVATVGLAKAVGALDAAGSSRVAIGIVEGRSVGWNFVVFVDYSSGRLLACTGVKRAEA